MTGCFTPHLSYHFSPKLNEELLPLEWDLDNLGPAEGVHFDPILEHDQTNRSYTQVYLAVGGVLDKREAVSTVYCHERKPSLDWYMQVQGRGRLLTLPADNPRNPSLHTLLRTHHLINKCGKEGCCQHFLVTWKETHATLSYQLLYFCNWSW